MNEKISARVGGKKTFHAVLIKPSHYDDDGYVIQWRNSVIPSNSLAVLYGLSQDLATSKVLGDDTEILVSAYDETNTRIPVDKIIEQIQSADGGFVGFTGVQSNQFPRTMDMAARFRRAGIQVCIGGFHISGCISMLKDLPPDIKRAMEMGVSLFAGEAEGGRLEGLFKDAYAGALKPLYNYLNELPAIESQPVPYLPNEILNRYAGALTSFDAGRGCPFKCSFCTIINVQGRKSRRRSADDVESIIKKNAARGYKNFFITDDNFARNRDWEAIFDRIIKLKETDGISINFTI